MIACKPPDSIPPDTAGLIIDDNERMVDVMKLLFELEMIVGILVATIFNLFNLLLSYDLLSMLSTIVIRRLSVHISFWLNELHR